MFCQSILFIYGQISTTLRYALTHCSGFGLSYASHSPIEWPNGISLISVLILAICHNCMRELAATMICWHLFSLSFPCSIRVRYWCYYSYSVFMSMFLKCITYDIDANVLGFSIWSKSSIMKSSLISGDLSFSFSPYLFLYFKYSKI